ncbi:hypothetical protein LCGC14_1330370 [marine sediment metagenome]|uniref:TIR domain-containing protein n=1 Tax=marine sediment metagenome TaxID=412755 RepID=A0A0F9KHH0_9ZZZZ
MTNCGMVRLAAGVLAGGVFLWQEPALVAREARPERIVLSYSHEDAEHAAVIRHRLIRAGCSVWWDGEIPAGSRYWGRAIERAIDGADVVLRLLGSPCDYCRNETGRAGRKGIRVVPTKLTSGADTPIHLERLQRLPLNRLEEICTKRPPA